MKKIIAPTDFSDSSENAAIYAGRLAEFYGAELWLYHAYRMPAPITEMSARLMNPEEMQAAVEYEMAVFKNKVLSNLRSTAKINTQTGVNSFSEGLEELCSSIKPDLVVMGLSGKNVLTRFIAGSNTIRAIRQLTCPVLVVPPQAEFIPVRKIGFACDFEKVRETTPVGPLKKLIRDFNADLSVLNVVYDDDGEVPEKKEQSIYIDGVLAEFKPSYQSVLSGDITGGINWFAEKEKLDLVVVIPKKHNLLEKIFSRSHTKDLLYHTHIPVLCMHE
jgi:nucleotide-binding universal stress UspA family protein